MSIPTQEALDTTRDTLEWLVANSNELEPAAFNTIACWEEAASQIPSEDELEDHE